MAAILIFSGSSVLTSCSKEDAPDTYFTFPVRQLH